MKLYHGDCLEELKKIPDNSVDSIVTDPPYGLSNTKPAQVADVLRSWISGDTNVVPAKRGGFMGKDWDSFVPPPAVWEECYRVLKPGGHMAVFAGTRTQDLMGLSIRLAGFEIREQLNWIYGTGFPKSMDVSKAIDKAAGAEREVLSERPAYGIGGKGILNGHSEGATAKVTAPATDEAKKWEGWGTALKPATEPIVLARKPLEGTVANNVLTYGTGGLNIDACRVGDDVRPKGASTGEVLSENSSMSGPNTGRTVVGTVTGRFPANVLLDEHAAKEMDKQSGVSVSRVRKHRDSHEAKESTAAYGDYGVAAYDRGTSDEGGASRFFPVFKYQAKAPKKERPVVEKEDGTKVQHPTVKPVALMEWLVTLVTPPNGVVLDPFAGSGTTLQAALNEGFDPIGVEQDADYIQLINKRLDTPIER